MHSIWNKPIHSLTILVTLSLKCVLKQSIGFRAVLRKKENNFLKKGFYKMKRGRSEIELYYCFVNPDQKWKFAQNVCTQASMYALRLLSLKKVILEDLYFSWKQWFEVKHILMYLFIINIAFYFLRHYLMYSSCVVDYCDIFIRLLIGTDLEKSSTVPIKKQTQSCMEISIIPYFWVNYSFIIR